MCKVRSVILRSVKTQQEAGASSVIDITEMVESSEPLPSFKFCIYKVPDPLRKLNEEAYNPRVISIGPFHHGNEKLQTMENYKARYLKTFIERAEINLEDLKRVVEDLEESVRHCYAETIPLSSDDFVTMILTDASFIIELFFRNKFNQWSSDDRIILKPWLLDRMQLDFILLENQLPFFIIDKLFVLAFPSMSQGSPSFVDLTFDYFFSYNAQKISPNPNSKILHFIDLLRKFYLPPCLPKRENKIIYHMYSATQLAGVGLKFEVDRSRSTLLDLHLDYKKGVLKIPPFILDDASELFVRNILALEQCHYPTETYVTDYFILLNFLLSGEKDLDLFRQRGILANGFGNKYATYNFINNLGTSMVYATMNSKYYNICMKLCKFYEEPGWLEYIRRNYFGTALRVVASTVTVLTLIQTVCSIISVVPHH